MPILEIQRIIEAPIEVCFDLSRDIDFHRICTSRTKEKAIAGVTAGLMGPGEEVTWEATHLGVRQRLTSRITAFDRPRHFRDSQVKGAFQRFDHDHFFRSLSPVTTLATDIFDYQSPLGPLGKLADMLFLEQYMRRFLNERQQLIKATAEARHRGSTTK